MWIVVGQVRNAYLERRRDPIAEFHHQLSVVVDPSSASSCERRELCWSCFCGSPAKPTAFADEHTSVPCVLQLQSIIAMKPIPMLNPSSI